MTRGEAKNLRLKIETAARELDDAAAVSMIELFPRYGVGKKYAVGDRIYYDGKLYRVICEHTSQEGSAAYACALCGNERSLVGISELDTACRRAQCVQDGR